MVQERSSGQIPDNVSPARRDRQVEKLGEDFKSKTEELEHLNRQVKIEREESKAASRLQQLSLERMEEELKTMRIGALLLVLGLSVIVMSSVIQYE